MARWGGMRPPRGAAPSSVSRRHEKRCLGSGRERCACAPASRARAHAGAIRRAIRAPPRNARGQAQARTRTLRAETGFRSTGRAGIPVQALAAFDKEDRARRRQRLLRRARSVARLARRRGIAVPARLVARLARGAASSSVSRRGEKRCLGSGRERRAGAPPPRARGRMQAQSGARYARRRETRATGRRRARAGYARNRVPQHRAGRRRQGRNGREPDGGTICGIAKAGGAAPRKLVAGAGE